MINTAEDLNDRLGQPVGWVNVYIDEPSDFLPHGFIYDTEEEAKESAAPYVVATIPVYK